MARRRRAPRRSALLDQSACCTIRLLAEPLDEEDIAMAKLLLARNKRAGNRRRARAPLSDRACPRSRKSPIPATPERPREPRQRATPPPRADGAAPPRRNKPARKPACMRCLRQRRLVPARYRARQERRSEMAAADDLPGGRAHANRILARSASLITRPNSRWRRRSPSNLRATYVAVLLRTSASNGWRIRPAIQDFEPSRETPAGKTAAQNPSAKSNGWPPEISALGRNKRRGVARAAAHISH